MKREFKTYLSKIGIISKADLDRIESILTDAAKLFPDEISSIFVGEYTQQDGTRAYYDLHLFSTKYSFTANSFLTEFEYYLLPMRKNVTHVIVQKKDYDFVAPTNDSRLSVSVQFKNSEIQSILTASAENCTFLKDIITKYFKPNIAA